MVETINWLRSLGSPPRARAGAVQGVVPPGLSSLPSQCMFVVQDWDPLLVYYFLLDILALGLLLFFFYGFYCTCAILFPRGPWGSPPLLACSLGHCCRRIRCTKASSCSTTSSARRHGQQKKPID